MAFSDAADRLLAGELIKLFSVEVENIVFDFDVAADLFKD